DRRLQAPGRFAAVIHVELVAVPDDGRIEGKDPFIRPIIDDRHAARPRLLEFQSCSLEPSDQVGIHEQLAARADVADLVEVAPGAEGSAGHYSENQNGK